jgi:uncharacterized protein (TIGR04141 family)
VLTADSVPYATFSIWTNGALAPFDVADADLLSASIPGDVLVVLLQRPRKTAPWQRFLVDAFNLNPAGTDGMSRGAIIFCAVPFATDQPPDLRWVAWRFGTGSRALSRNATDPRFGLIVALNALVASPDGSSQGDSADAIPRRGAQLRELRYKTSTPYVQTTDHRAAKSTPIQGFRVDRQSDLVSTIGGETADPVLGTVLGGRSIQFRAEVSDVPQLVSLTDDLMPRAQQRNYHTDFGWIDNISPVFDDSLILRLKRTVLAELVEHPQSPSIDVLLPDDLLDPDADRSIQYVQFPRNVPPQRTG